MDFADRHSGDLAGRLRPVAADLVTAVRIEVDAAVASRVDVRKELAYSVEFNDVVRDP